MVATAALECDGIYSQLAHIAFVAKEMKKERLSSCFSTGLLCGLGTNIAELH